MNKLSLVIIFVFFWSNIGFTEDMNVKKKIRFFKDLENQKMERIYKLQ